ncbi:Structural maintenance of chromosomes protein 4 [Halotydeus destructor]|nr:Structural maintenance of chromosomes protein 4 [Halotydeus destructor]
MSESTEKVKNAVSNQRKDDSDDEDLEFHEEAGGYHIGDVYIPPPPPPPKYSGDQTGTRLVITHIENINFKSYAGTQVLGPFHKSFTSIVGPNGSGKSNVIDSMLFVFGYRAQKLRSKKLSVLIHNSDTHPNLTSCEVRVHFALIEDKGGDDYDIVPNSEFVISRSASKDNSSGYFIGRKKVHFKEVSQVLQSNGIDLRYNRFLILQGEVEQIALMKPKAENENDTGMLEFLEDIIGSTRLKAPLGRIKQKVDEMNDLRSQKINRVKVVEKEKEALKGPMEEAMKFVETENSLAKKKNLFYQIQKAEAEEERQEAFRTYEQAENAFKSAMAEIDKVTDQKTEQEKEMHDFHVEYSKHNVKLEKLTEAFKDLERRDMQFREQIKHTKAKGKKLLAEQEKETANLVNLKDLPDTLIKEIDLAKEKKNDAESKKEIADKKFAEAMNQLKSETEKLQEEKDVLESKLLGIQKNVSEARSKKELAQSELELYVSKERTEKAKLDQLNFKLESHEKDIESSQAQIEKLETTIPGVKKEIGKLTDDIEKLEAQNRQVTDKYRSDNSKLMELKNAVSSVDTRNKLLRSVMEANKKGTLQGVLGRLGDLGAIDKKFDVAISTACGALDNIVVDTIDSAQSVIEFIKERDLGKTTCMALDKLNYSEDQINYADTNSEGCPRLFDLVEINDDRLRPAFYHALRNTLVAKDLSQATRIKGRHRIVTLDGKLVEASGAMSGGGRPASGRMGFSIASSGASDQEIKELEASVVEAQAVLREVSEKVSKNHRELDQLRSDLDAMVNRLPKVKMDLDAKARGVSEIRKSIKMQEKVVKEAAPDKERVKELEKCYKKLEKTYDSVSSEANTIEEDIEQVNDKIREVMDKTVGSAKKAVEKLKTEIHSLDTEITKKGVAHKTALRNIEKSEDKLKSIEQEIEESTQLITALKEDTKKLEAEATTVTDDYEEAEKEKSLQETKLKQFQAVISKLKAEESRLKSENVDAKHEKEKHEAALKEKEAEVKHWLQKISELKLQSIGVQEDTELPVLSAEELATLNSHSLKNDMDNLEKELKKMKPNMSAIDEYKKKDSLYLERFKELEEATRMRDEFKKQHDQLKEQRLSEFKQGFQIINSKLKEMYRMITAGGDAELEFSDSLNPFSEGINFSVRPNKKSWKRISNLSGGEKTLSSLALIFALHYFKPSPLYVMDEIDAALDFKNVSIVANYIKERTRNTQFIIISLRNNMYELADRLVGIYKTYNCTKSVTVIPDAVEKRRKQTVDLSSTCTTSRPSDPVGDSLQATSNTTVFA